MELKLKHIAILAILVVAVLIVFAKRPGSNVSAKQTSDPGRTVAVVLAQRGTLTNSITLSGEFRPYQQVDIHAKVAGFIQRIYVDVGDKVKAGQTLAVLEVPELNAQVAEARAQIRRCQDSIHRAQSEIERSESEHASYRAAYSRLKQASESKPGLIAEQELDDFLAKDKSTGAQVDSARATLAEAQSQLSASEANLDRLAAMESYARITAPFPSVVTKRYADTGALIQAGTTSDTQSMPVVQLAEWSRLRLVVPVPESSVSQLALGSTVQVYVSALNRTFEGKVARFADALNDETRTMHTEIDVENPAGTLKDGMYAEVKLVLQEERNVLTVPIQAVDRNNSLSTVLVVDKQGRVQSRDIKLGLQNSNRVEVLDGLAEKDRVIVGSRAGFRPGEPVTAKVVASDPNQPEDSF